MSLAPGTNVGPYEILATIGAGGMGEVYRARDRKLDRDVAIKVLPAALSQDPERLARFEREAKVLASLNHPNIAAIYGVEDRALVMEFVEGSAPKGPLPFDDAWKIASQVAGALDYAHERGIIHRDLKPANIMITPEGVVKLLDFGLAKAFTNRPDARGSTPDDPENSPTLTIGATEVGVILGTAAYMPPEQAKGKTVDKRADIWAFGVVFYELLTGERLFKGEDVADTLARVLTKEPDLSNVPPQTRKLLARCLEKDPRKRLRDIGDAPYLLDDVGQAISSPAAAPRHRAWLPWYIAAFLLLALMPANIIHFRETQPADSPLVRLDVDLGPDVSLPAPTPGGSGIAISPDGTRLVYTSGNARKLFTRSLDQTKATELPGTQGAAAPFFSADSLWIGFQTAARLNKISVQGGAVVPLGDFAGAGVSWGQDGNIYMSVRGKGLVRIRDSGGAPETVAALANGETSLNSPQILPGGKAVLFSAFTPPDSDAATIEVMTLADRHRKTVSRGTSPRYLATSNGTGHLVYLNKASLFAIPFDLDKLETRGTALPILDDVAYNPTFGRAELAVSGAPSGHGTLVYRKGGGDARLLTVAWLDGAGKTQPLLAKPGVYGRPNLSPDGRRLALVVTDGSGADIWVYDWQRDTMTRLTFDGKVVSPVWTPDGRYIVFASAGAGMFVTRSDGAGKAQPLTQSKNNQSPWSFTADGKRIAFMEQDSPKTAYHVWTVPIESDGAGLRAGKPEVFLQTPADERYPAFSPDGRWLAYVSNESGTFQVYVRAFPDKGGKWQISNNGGTYPMWSRGDLFFETGDQHIMAAAYTVKGESFVAGKPRIWSEKQIGSSASNNKNLDLAPDGKRIVALMPATEAKESQEAQNHVVFLLNFFDYLRQRVPLAK
jgi:serine/threonine protein kinase/Tol biopolymer transport system component